MKSNSLRIPSLATLIAAFLVLSSGAVQAQVLGKSGRTANAEDDAMRPSGRLRLPGRAVSRHRLSPGAMAAAARRAAETAPSGYPRYQLIDMGTLGGPESTTMFPARGINNQGQLIASSQTGVEDPNCFLDCLYNHAMLRQANGTIIELPFPGGIDPTNNYSLAGDITANGWLGGFVTNGRLDPLTGVPQMRPAVWGPSHQVRDLGTFGGNSGAVNMLTRRGDAVGMALNAIPENPDFAFFMNGFIPAATQARAFLWQGGRLRDLGTLGGNDAAAFAVNESGTIYGISYTDTSAHDSTGLPTTHPFLWRNGRMQDLGTLGGTLATPGSFCCGPWAPALNEHGQAIGTSMLAGDEFYHGFLWDNGAMIDLGTLGGDFSEAFAINESGWVVGRSDLSPDSPFHHAVLWRGGAIQDLGMAGQCKNATATAINSAGAVIGGLGRCTDNPDDLDYFSAFIWRPGRQMADLNSLVVPTSQLQIEFATDIDDTGRIAANAYLPTGEIHGVLLVPVP